MIGRRGIDSDRPGCIRQISHCIRIFPGQFAENLTAGRRLSNFAKCNSQVRTGGSVFGCGLRECFVNIDGLARLTRNEQKEAILSI